MLDPALSGPVNAVAPGPVRNADYTAVLAGLLTAGLRTSGFIPLSPRRGGG